MRADYQKEHFQKVMIKGIICEFIDIRIVPDTVPVGKFQYEVAGDDESGGEPARIKKGILVNFYGTLICDEKLPLGDDGVLWLETGDFIYL